MGGFSQKGKGAFLPGGRVEKNKVTEKTEKNILEGHSLLEEGGWGGKMFEKKCPSSNPRGS